MDVPSNWKMSRSRTSRSETALSSRSVSFSGSPGKKIWVTKRSIQLFAKDREVDVRRPPPPARFEHGIRSRLDGEELEVALGVGHQPAFAREVGIDGRIVPIGVVDVLAGRVRLPDLDRRAGERRSVFIRDAPADLDELSRGPRRICSMSWRDPSARARTGRMPTGPVSSESVSGRGTRGASGVRLKLSG